MAINEADLSLGVLDELSAGEELFDLRRETASGMVESRR